MVPRQPPAAMVATARRARRRMRTAARADLATVGRVNDLAYGLPTPKLAPADPPLPDTVRTYGVRARTARSAPSRWPSTTARRHRRLVRRHPPEAQRQGPRRHDPPAPPARGAAARATAPPRSRPAPPAGASTSALGFVSVGASTSTRSGSPDAPQPRARARPASARAAAAGRRRLPALARLPALRLRRLLQPQAGRRGDPAYGRRPDHPAPPRASTRARTCGPSRAASSTSASRSRTPPSARRGRSSTSRSSSTRLVGVYSRADTAIVLIVYAATTTDDPRTTEEADEVALVDPADLPWGELAFWSTERALRDYLSARFTFALAVESPPPPAHTTRSVRLPTHDRARTPRRSFTFTLTVPAPAAVARPEPTTLRPLASVARPTPAPGAVTAEARRPLIFGARGDRGRAAGAGSGLRPGPGAGPFPPRAAFIAATSAPPKFGSSPVAASTFGADPSHTHCPPPRRLRRCRAPGRP